MLRIVWILLLLFLWSGKAVGFLALNTVPRMGIARFRKTQVMVTASATSKSATSMNIDTMETSKTTSSSNMLIGTESGKKYYPAGTKYCQCSCCKTAYLMDEETLGAKGLKIICGICKKDWFQTSERLMTTDAMNFLMPMPAVKVDEVKRILAEKNIPKYTRVDKISIFVGNLPYKYTEEDVTNLFAEYGLTSVALVKDTEQQSKGFAFIECSNSEDAERLMKEMNGFYTEPNRRLTVNLTKAKGGEGGGRGTFRPRNDEARERPGSGEQGSSDDRPSTGKSWSRAKGFVQATDGDSL